MPVPRSDTRQANHEDCQSVSTLVMALFDGEADELQARRARNHLLICQTCANRWLDWNRARSLLLSVPAPTPPETLMWRVLSACRRAGTSRAGASCSGAGTANPSSLPTLAFGTSLEAPSALSQQILERTTRAGTLSTSRRIGWNSTRRVLTWPALAAPSLALWLLVLQRQPLLISAQIAPDSAADSTTDSSFSTEPAHRGVARRGNSFPRAAAVLDAAATRADGGRHLSVRASAPTATEAKTAVQTPRVEVRPTALTAVSDPTSARSISKTRVLSASEIDLARQWDEIQALTSQAARTTRFQTSETGASWQTADFSAPSAAAFAAPRPVLARLATAPRRAIRPSTSRLSAESRLSAAAPRLMVGTPRRAELSSELAAPRLRAANWRISSPRVASAATASPAVPSRVSLPAAAASSARLIADNFDADQNRADDGHIDEMRSVVDDFRATVASETTPDAGAAAGAGENDGG